MDKKLAPTKEPASDRLVRKCGRKGAGASDVTLRPEPGVPKGSKQPTGHCTGLLREAVHWTANQRAQHRKQSVCYVWRDALPVGSTEPARLLRERAVRRCHRLPVSGLQDVSFPLCHPSLHKRHRYLLSFPFLSFSVLHSIEKINGLGYFLFDNFKFRAVPRWTMWSSVPC